MTSLTQFTVTFAMDCSQLVKIVSESEKWLTFGSYLKDIKVFKRNFNSSELIHILRTHNSNANSLAHSARKQLSFGSHIDVELLF